MGPGRDWRKNVRLSKATAKQRGLSWRKQHTLIVQPAYAHESWWAGLDRESFQSRASVEAVRMKQERINLAVLRVLEQGAEE